MFISLGMVVLNRFAEVQENLRRTCPHVDRTIVVDGGSEDGTTEWLQSDEAKSLGIECIVHKQVRLQYGNHTPTERNLYLDKMSTDTGNWALVLDSDEFLEDEALTNLRSLAEKAEKQGYNKICFRAHDVWTYLDGRVHDAVSNYYHHSMFFKTWPSMQYVGHTHSGINRPGLQDKPIAVDLEYKHIKNEATMWKSSAYLWWTSAQEASNTTDDETWLGFHDLMKQYDYYDWHVFKKVMEKGEVPEEIKQWIIEHRNDDNSEAAAYFVHYFVHLHPEQNIDKLKSDRYNVDWDYVLNCTNTK